MSNKYLDETGLARFWSDIKAFFAPNADPSAPGTADKGSSSKFARQDHVHPLQTSVSGNAGTATKLANNGNTIDGLSFDGSSPIVHYATCTVAASTAAKTASFPTGVNPVYALTTGLRVAVKFSNANTANSPTLNVASLGTKNIYHNGAQITTGSNKALLAGTVEFVYDGTNWQLVGNYINSTYTAASATPLMDGTGAVGSSAKYAREDHVHPSDTTKVTVEEGKGLSSNDYTTAEKNKLAGIASGAEVNQNAYSNVHLIDTTEELIQAEYKTSTLELIAGNNLSLSKATGDVSEYAVSIAVKTSPAFTGTPTAPTATAGTNTTQIATTAFVNSAISTAISGASSFQGTVSANSTISNSSYKKGWYWVVATAGTYVGETCEVGDMIFAINNKGSAYAASDFSVVQSNLDLVAITNSEIDAIVV